MENYSPIYTFKGTVRADSAPSGNDDLVRKQDVAGLSYIKSIDSGSSSYLSVDATGALKVNQLLVTDVIVDTTSASLAAYIGTLANPTGLNKGDIIILTQPANNLMYIVKAGTGSAAGDYEEIQSSLSQAEILAHISGGAGININASGVISFNGDSDLVSEGSVNQYYTQARFNNAFLAKTTTQLSEGTNQYFTQARARASISASATSGLQYSSGALNVYVKSSSGLIVDSNGVYINFDNTTIGLDGSGEVSFRGDTDDVSEGTSNLYFSNARARTAVSGGGDLNYNNSTGAFSVTTYKSADFNTDFAGKSTTNLGEGTNLYHTTARARAAISGSSGVSYNNTTGAISLNVSHIRKEFSGEALSANTAKTLNHNLGERFVHVSVYDSLGNKIHCDIVCVNANSCTVKSVTALTNVEIIVSL
jgi:hypothetical protein